MRATSYSTYFSCHHRSTATVLILLVTSEQLTEPRAELLSGLSSELLTPSHPLHTHTQTHTRIYAAYTAAKTPMHFLHMQSHSYIHPHFGPPSHTLCSRCLNLSNTFIDALLHRVISTARQKIRRDLTAIQINPPLSCSECWCQNIPPNRLGQRTCSLSKN